MDDDIARANGGTVPAGFNKDASNEGGVDLVIKDNGDEVVIETKYYTAGGLSDEQLEQATRGTVQFSDE